MYKLIVGCFGDGPKEEQRRGGGGPGRKMEGDERCVLLASTGVWRSPASNHSACPVLSLNSVGLLSVPCTRLWSSSKCQAGK